MHLILSIACNVQVCDDERAKPHPLLATQWICWPLLVELKLHDVEAKIHDSFAWQTCHLAITDNEEGRRIFHTVSCLKCVEWLESQLADLQNTRHFCAAKCPLTITDHEEARRILHALCCLKCVEWLERERFGHVWCLRIQSTKFSKHDLLTAQVLHTITIVLALRRCVSSTA